MEERERSIACERYLSLWAVPMGFLLFVVGYTWYLSLAHTAVSINTAIYNCLGVCGWRRCVVYVLVWRRVEMCFFFLIILECAFLKTQLHTKSQN